MKVDVEKWVGELVLIIKEELEFFFKIQIK